MRLARSIAVAVLVTCGAGPPHASAQPVDFAHQIVPLLQKHCGVCHTGDKKEGGYSMNTRTPLMAGGDGGKTVVAGNSAQSELIRRVLSRDKDDMMPPEGPRLSENEVEVLKRWIDGGVDWEEGLTLQPPTNEPPLLPRRVELPPVVDSRTNPVDRIVDAYFSKRGVDRPRAVSDVQFVRRLSLDLVGLLPTAEQVQRFVDDTQSDKRNRLVQELLSDDVAYAEHWLTFWNDLLRNDYAGTGFITGGRKQITTWLYRALVANKPYDQMVRELIAPTPESEGFIQGIRWRGTVSASQSQEIQFAQNISQAFLGINMKCASCHDSFVDRWKLSEAYGLAAVYATQPLAMHRCDKPIGQSAKAAWIFPELGQIDADAPQPERLNQLAGLMTHQSNGRFTRTIVNRLWHRLMGRGIVHPVDAMHTEPWSADLLDFLAADFADHGYDLKHTLKLICTSRIYQVRTPPLTDETDGDNYIFRGPFPRRMTAEQFVDAVWQLTGAAPARLDAQVIRYKPEALASEPKREPTPLQASWIWTRTDFDQAPAGQAVTFRKQFQLPAAPIRAVAVITADNEYRLLVNGREAAADASWDTVEIVPLDPYLKVGRNEILIAAKNGGRAPNIAGLIFEARIKLADRDLTIATSDDWQWTATEPNPRGKLREVADWQPAVKIKPAAAWTARVGQTLPTLLHHAAAGPIRMTRASLVKNDDLMRALGRPARDQIVSMRPSELTTLEAIALANGETLAKVIDRGAQKWMPKNGESSSDLIKRIYVAALCRPSTADELTAASQLLGTSPNRESIEDLLWTLMMLPEFQLIR